LTADDVQQVVHQQRGRSRRNAPGLLPRHVAVSHVARSVGTDRPKLRTIVVRDEEHEPVPINRPGNGGKAVVPDLPEFLSRHGIVRVDGLRSRTDKLPPGPAGNHERHGECLSLINGDRSVIERAVRFPGGLSVRGVESDQVLDIAAVDIHDQQVSQQERGTAGPGPGFMVAVQIAPRPKDGSRGGIQTRRTVGAEMHVDPARLDHRRRCRVGILRSDWLRPLDVKDVKIVEDLPGLPIHADGEQPVTIPRGSRHPDLISANDGRGPSVIMDGRLPDSPLVLTPGQREMSRAGVPLTGRPTKLPPILVRRQRTGDIQSHDDTQCGCSDK